MMTELREVRLYGALGRRFGRVHRMAVGSAAEAVRALCVVLDGFEAHLMRYSQPGYHVFSGRYSLAEDDLAKPAGGREVIRIVPAVVGAKRAGVLQTIGGAVLVVAGAAYGAYTGDWATAKVGIQMGAAMMIGGVVQMLSPQRKANGDDKVQNAPSYSFNGPANTDAEGGCVPVLYGQMLVGSVVISGGIRTQDIAV